MRGGEEMEAGYISMTIDQAAEESRIGRDQLMHWIRHEDDFPCFKVGKKWIIPREGFTKWINDRAAARVGLSPMRSAALHIIRQKRAERNAE